MLRKTKKAVKENKGKTIILASLIPVLIGGFNFGGKIVDAIDNIENARTSADKAQAKSDRNHGTMNMLNLKLDSLLKLENNHH